MTWPIVVDSDRCPKIYKFDYPKIRCKNRAEIKTMFDLKNLPLCNETTCPRHAEKFAMLNMESTEKHQHSSSNTVPVEDAEFKVETTGARSYFACHGCALIYADRNMGLIERFNIEKAEVAE